MAARKRKAKKAARPKKAKKAPARKAKKTGKASKKAPKTPPKKTKKAAKAPARKAKQKIIGEGDYAASKSFLKDQAGFVEKNKAKIPAMGKAAEKALEGPEGDTLRDAEAAAMARSRDTF